jgi:hypothetical protein
MDDSSRKIQDLVKKLRGLLLKFKKLEGKYRVSEEELESERVVREELETRLRSERKQLQSVREEFSQTQSEREDILEKQLQSVREEFSQKQSEREDILEKQLQSVREEFSQKQSEREDILEKQLQSVREELSQKQSERENILKKQLQSDLRNSQGKYHTLAQKMKKSLCLIQSLRVEKKQIEQRYIVLKEKAAKHLVTIEKERDLAQKNAQEQVARKFSQEQETVRTNEMLRARLGDLQNALIKAERDLREIQRRRSSSSSSSDTMKASQYNNTFQEQKMTVLRHENQIALKNAKAAYENEIRMERSRNRDEIRDISLCLCNMKKKHHELETQNENEKQKHILERKTIHIRIENELQDARKKLQEAQEKQQRRRLNVSADKSLSSRVVHLKTELAEERIRRAALSRDLTKSYQVSRTRALEIEEMRSEYESATEAVELGKSQIAMLSRKLSSSVGGGTGGILSGFWS